MSRYQALMSNSRSVVWGYDQQLDEFFLEEHWAQSEVAMDPLKEDSSVFAIGTKMTFNPHPLYPGKMIFTNEEIATIMANYITYIGPDDIARVHNGTPF